MFYWCHIFVFHVYSSISETRQWLTGQLSSFCLGNLETCANYGQHWISHKQKCLASGKCAPDLWFPDFAPNSLQATATKGSTPNWPLVVVVIALVGCYRCVRPEWPIRISTLHRSDGGGLLSERIWPSQLLLGRPGGRFQVRSGTHPRDVDLALKSLMCWGVLPKPGYSL